ncbi:hypothetical protein HDV06_003309, partial [Boothiomyces sp. JEL0866]
TEYENLAWKEQNLAQKKQNLARKKELLLLKERESLRSATPEEVLKELLGFDIETAQVNFSRPSMSLNGIPTDEISYIVPLMKFVCREEPTQTLYNTLDDYLDWRAKRVGESEKNIKFVIVVGTSGKGKTTFARRFIDLKYTGKHSAIINDCRDCNRRYRVSCTNFDLSRDAETQLSLLVLFEAFKHSIGPVILQDFVMYYHRNFTNKIYFSDVLQLITERFCIESSPIIHQRLLIINLDETNDLLYSEESKNYLKKLFRVLRNAANSFCLLTVLSGTHSVELYTEVQNSNCKFVDIELSLIGLEAAKEVILGMTANPSEYNILPYLEYVLTLCGGVGRYLELAIIQMSIMGSAEMENTEIKGFKLEAYQHFLKKLQTSQHTETLLDKLTVAVLEHYPKVFFTFSECIELLSCYTLFQWSVQRQTKINNLSVGHLEKKGLVFLQPVPNAPDTYICIVPFITLYWAIKHSNQTVQIPFLKNIKSYFSPEESENNSLHIMMAKLWGLTQKNGLTADATGQCTIMLSELLNLRDEQPDVR